MGARLSIASGLNIPEWRKMLVDYHDNQIVDYLKFGWPADYTASMPPTPTHTNHTDNPTQLAAIRRYVQTELARGAMLSPFQETPFNPLDPGQPHNDMPQKVHHRQACQS